MATYQELRSLFTDSDLLEKVEVAIIISANNLVENTPTIADKIWAAEVFDSPNAEAKKALKVILASNSSLSVSQIQGSSDSAIQTKVDSIVPTLVDAKAGA